MMRGTIIGEIIIAMIARRNGTWLWLSPIAASVPGVVKACCVRVHPLGATWSVELEITVEGQATVAEGHKLAHEVEERITQARDQIVRVQVHVNPA